MTNKEDDDIYEFKTTPKDATSGDDKSDSGSNKNSDKSSSDEKSSADDSTAQTKRPYTDVETGEDGSSANDDENKRKKRKDADSTTAKESSKSVGGPRGVPGPRQDKSGKAVGATPKSVQLTGKSGAIDRKSPCASPKPASKTTDSDAETDGESKSDNFSAAAGPKVPPLKIVIPQQNTTGDQETGSRNGKNTSARSHAALPYVVASSNRFVFSTS